MIVKMYRNFHSGWYSLVISYEPPHQELSKPKSRLTESDSSEEIQSEEKSYTIVFFPIITSHKRECYHFCEVFW